MADKKTQLMQELDTSRVEFWNIIDALDDDADIYPGWKKREMMAHIAGWDALVWNMLHDALTGAPPKTYPHNNLRDLEAANAAFVAEHAGATIANVRLACDINRFAIKTLLDSIPADAFVTQALPFSWRDHPAAEWVRGAIDHEYEHGADMQKLLKK